MSSNSALIPVKDHGWLNGFGNFFRKESHQWWGTWQWVIQIVIWLAIVDGMMAMVTLAAPRIEAAQARQELSTAEATAARNALKDTALLVFFVFSGLAPAVGVVILAQDALIGERQAGTTAWVLSKPVSRTAFILSKVSADMLGILGTMIAVQGVVAYLIYKAGTGVSLPLGGFVGGLALVGLVLIFYLSLTYMLGTIFKARGAVIGIPMLLIFGNQLTGLLPWLGDVMPWNLVIDLGPDRPALAVKLAQGLPLPTMTPIISSAILAVLFFAVALWRFQKEEF